MRLGQVTFECFDIGVRIILKLSALRVAMRQRPEQFGPRRRRRGRLREELAPQFLLDAAPPLKGRANQALIAYLSDILKVSKSRLSIEKGLTSRRKVVSVQGMSEEEAKERIESFQS